MLILASHIVCLLTLTVGSVYDVITTEVPDYLPALAVISGLTLHGVSSYLSGSYTPIMWSIGVGALFSAYGWGMYFTGMWGGADAFSLSALGFAAPYGLSGPGLIHPVNLFINIMLVGFVYTVVFAIYKGIQAEGVMESTVEEIKTDKLRFGLEIVAGASLGLLATIVFDANLLYPVATVTMVFLYRFLASLESKVMETTKKVEKLEPGEVVSSGEVDGKVKGITEEEISRIESEEVTVKTGVRFVPVFPVALLLTDVFGGGIGFLVTLFSL